MTAANVSRNPSWDEKGAARPHLTRIRQGVTAEALSADEMDVLLTSLVRDLRAVYPPAEANIALANCERLIAADIDRVKSLKTSVQPATSTASIATPSASVATAVRPLNGKALKSSVFPTWLALVSLSWVSLIWGALISLPFGIGFAVLGSLFAGIVAVPVWGTLFGFMGMGAAASATTRSMNYKTLDKDHPLRATAEGFAKVLEIPVPQLGTVSNFNAFAMGADPRSAMVAMGEPLLKALTPAETAAVLGHELGHVVSGDMRRMTLMRTFQNATVWFTMFQGFKQIARWVICWAAELYILAFSRKREYWADAIGAALTSKEAMIGALKKLEAAPALTSAEQTNARFMVRGRAHSVLSTHPSFAERIEALERETYLARLPRQKAA